METLMFIIAVVIVIFIIGLGKINDSGSIKKYTKREYRYTKKSCVITENELSFYKTLQEAVSGCIIIPQAHLSMFLEHRIKGQSWNGALNKIDRKSIDFLICTNDMSPLIAVELDDSTHNQPRRKERDNFVNSIISDAGISLLRFRTNEWNSDLIKQRITQAFQK